MGKCNQRRQPPPLPRMRRSHSMWCRNPRHAKRVASSASACVWVVVIILIDFAHERALISIESRESGVEWGLRAEGEPSHLRHAANPRQTPINGFTRKWTFKMLHVIKISLRSIAAVKIRRRLHQEEDTPAQIRRTRSQSDLCEASRSDGEGGVQCTSSSALLTA